MKQTLTKHSLQATSNKLDKPKKKIRSGRNPKDCNQNTFQAF